MPSPEIAPDVPREEQWSRLCPDAGRHEVAALGWLGFILPLLGFEGRQLLLFCLHSNLDS